jgi:hypothetical protein
MIDLWNVLNLVLHRVVLYHFPLSRHVFNSCHWLVLYDCLFVGNVLDTLLPLYCPARLVDIDSGVSFSWRRLSRSFLSYLFAHITK